jgi:hypothetical protein
VAECNFLGLLSGPLGHAVEARILPPTPLGESLIRSVSLKIAIARILLA